MKNPAHLAVVLFTVLLLPACSTQAVPERSPARAKNVILFIGDGMGVATVTAARIFDGQSKGLQGEEHQLTFETLPNVALVKTYNTNQQTPDSAGTATAMVTGNKTRAGMINIAPNVRREDCAASLENRMPTITQLAKSRGLAVGVVTTTRVTHATPAVTYAYTPERDWEHDADLPAAAQQSGCRDVAWQLVHAAPGGGLDVAMGGSHESFFGSDNGGERRDPGANLVREWLDKGENRRYVETSEQMAAAQPGEQLLGLFTDDHMTYVAEHTADTTEPLLAEMTAKAIELLANDDDGFFLMVEGGRIDHGHHDGKPGYALIETTHFDDAVETALSMVNTDETLVLVTADHSHVFTMGGYATRGSPILGYVVENNDHGEPLPGPDLAHDGEPYTILSYANGRGAVTELPRPKPQTGIDAVFQSLVPVVNYNADGSIADFDETHGGEDVALYGIGPGSDQVRGVIEQNLVYDIMMNALGWR